MNKEILKIVSSIYGKKCCRVAVGDYKSLSFGFGAKIFLNDPRSKYEFYGEWEIGTFCAGWRVIKNNKIILGSRDSSGDGHDIHFLDNKINEVKFGELVGITNFSEFDVRVVFSNGITVDFIPAFSRKDHIFHIFCPEHKYIEFKSGLWKIGRSDIPWDGR